MLIIPAIDLKDGCVVRFLQGRLKMKIYSRDPVKTARHWVKQGAEYLHLVDLDGAFTGKPVNLAWVKEIVRSVDIPVQFGGGVRKIQAIKSLLEDYGLARVVLGTKAVQDRGFLKKAFHLFRDKVIVSVDARAGRAMTEGWKSSAGSRDALSFACELKKIGFKQVIYTDIAKDGTLSGPNIKDTKDLLKRSGLKVITSGGVACLEDIFKLKKLEKDGLIAVIVGKALYEGRFTLSEAIKMG
jgi:phosphoribosylformimino-5-aminoimidazole carboxamide ribotide isomerase